MCVAVLQCCSVVESGAECIDGMVQGAGVGGMHVFVTLQHAATRCNTRFSLSHTHMQDVGVGSIHVFVALQHAAAHASLSYTYVRGAGVGAMYLVVAVQHVATHSTLSHTHMRGAGVGGMYIVVAVQRCCSVVTRCNTIYSLTHTHARCRGWRQPCMGEA